MNNELGFNKAIMPIENYEHRLYGIGCIAYEYTENEKILKIFIDYDRHSTRNIPFKILTDQEAKDTFEKFLKDRKDVNILSEELIINIACEVTKKSPEQIKERTRDEYCVFARNLVFWAARKYMKYSLNRAGAIFNLDHATVLRAYKILEDREDKYFADWQVYVKSEFILKLKPYINKQS
jgi:chromosomal replication initiator protein